MISSMVLSILNYNYNLVMEWAMGIISSKVCGCAGCNLDVKMSSCEKEKRSFKSIAIGIYLEFSSSDYT